MTTRRRFNQTLITGLAGAAFVSPAIARADHHNPTRVTDPTNGAPAEAVRTARALLKSQLVYMTPIQSNGRESRCHAEVWFVYGNDVLWVVTASDAWRNQAVVKGLRQAKAWVGEHGVWSQGDDSFRQGVEIDLIGRRITDDATHRKVLNWFGVKYAKEWDSWGPKFSKGLKDGSRSMLGYSLA